MQLSEFGTYLAPGCVMPFCKGCGHSHVLRRLNDALVTLDLNPSDVCLVTDIGCIGLADSLFETPHSVHTTHGRSTAFATGIALADRVLASGRLKTIVLIGDGGAMIGLLHLVNAALLNADVTVLVCNNFLFGMTGGQNSAMSPVGFITPTTPGGNLIPPLDICKVVADCHAGYVVRKVATDPTLTATIVEAIARPGFSLVEVVELCTEHGTTRNPLTGRGLEEVLKNHGQTLGVIADSTSREGFGKRYREKFPIAPAKDPGLGTGLPNGSVPGLNRRMGVIVAGSAGEKVQSAAARFCTSAIEQGIFCTQKNDNPVTQGSGFSIAEIVLSPEPVDFTGIEVPEVVVVVSEEGLQELDMQGVFERLTPNTTLYIDSSLTQPSSAAKVVAHPFRSGGGKEAAGKALDLLRSQIGF